MKQATSRFLMLILTIFGLCLLALTVFVFVYQYIAAIGMSHAVIQAFGDR